jgi:aspartate/glutamate racemase
LKYCRSTCTVIHAGERACNYWIEKDEYHKKLEEKYIHNIIPNEHGRIRIIDAYRKFDTETGLFIN